MTVNKKGSILFEHDDLKCDLCGSEDVADETQGYVCRDCGVVLTVQKLQYDRPYNNDIVQYSVQFGATQIGNARERSVHPHSYQLRRMSKYNSQLTNNESAKLRASKEISRIFECLSLPKACEHRVKATFKEIFPKLQPGSKYKNPEKLAAILIYIALKLENVTIKRKDIINNSGLTKDTFNNFILQIQQYLPSYTKRNRQDYVVQKLMEITEHFGLDMSFYFLSHKVLSKLWQTIKNTTDDVIAGLCTSITALCSFKSVISVSAICDLLNIKMSTIQFQVKNRIFKRFRVPGFVSLVRSAELLRKFMMKVGLIEGEKLDVEVIQEEADELGENVVSIKLGETRRIFNPHNEHYLIEAVGENQTITLCYLEVYNHSNPKRRKSSKKLKKDVWFGLTSSEYYPMKGPPLVDIT